MTTSPKNAQEALQQANRLQRARAILAEGYTFHKDKDSEAVAVCKPGRLAASYWINLLSEGCDCPDSMKGNDCKHLLAWKLLETEKADDAANMEAQCKQWEEENPLDCIPTPTLESIAIKDLTAKMQADLEHVQADIAAQGERRTGYIHRQHLTQRAGRLENAIETVNQYRCPADVPPHQFCAVCGIANLHGPRCFGEDCPNRITR
jgi:hypothetical protein